MLPGSNLRMFRKQNCCDLGHMDHRLQTLNLICIWDFSVNFSVVIMVFDQLTQIWMIIGIFNESQTNQEKSYC